MISGTLSYTSAGTHAVTATVSDGDRASSTTFTWTVTNVNRAPVLTASRIRPMPRTRPSRCRSSASDPDGDAVTYSATGLPERADARPDDWR